MFYMPETALPNTTGNKDVQIQWTSDQTYESQTIVMACEGVQQALPPNKFGLYGSGVEPYDEFTAAENDVDESWIYSQIAWDQGTNWQPDLTLDLLHHSGTTGPLGAAASKNCQSGGVNCFASWTSDNAGNGGTHRIVLLKPGAP